MMGVSPGRFGIRDFEVQAAPFRRELLAHCYRMTGSFHDAEDLVQDTMLRAWRASDTYDAEAGVTADMALSDCNQHLPHRAAETFETCAAVRVGRGWTRVNAVLAPDFETPWLEPFPTDGLPDPADAATARESLRLAFIAAAQGLPARQQAMWLLREVLRWPAAEIADCLDVTVAAVNSGVQRARATLD